MPSPHAVTRSRVTTSLWRLVALIVVITVAIGAVSGLALYHFAPDGVTRTLAAMQHPTPLPNSANATPSAGDGIATVPPSSATAAFQQLNQSLLSYQEQPMDAHTGLRLIITKLGINAPIVERGVQDGWMVVAPGATVTHFVYSAYPGALGNTILYSHSGTEFRHLDSLAVHDTIVVQTPNGSVQFRVRELRIVSPTSLSVLDATPTAVLTILTCYPFGVDSSRLVVIADLV